METSNPYHPPRAAVADVEDHDGEFQKMTVWGWRGRLGRLRFLAYGTVAYVVYMLAAVAVGVLAGVGGGFGADEGRGAGLFAGVVWLLLVPYLIFLALVTIRRSHDMGWSGWMSLLAFIPFVGLIWLFKAGTKGPNGYGPPPPPNTFGVKLAAFGLILVFFVGGILAAIAIPAYQQYVKRAEAAQIEK